MQGFKPRLSTITAVNIATYTLMGLCLSACTPRFDWRSSAIKLHGERIAITFPGKSLSASKTVTLNGQPQPLTLHAVQVDSAQFALGGVPATDAAQAQQLARALAAAFASNLNAAPNVTVIQLSNTAGAFDVKYRFQATDTSTQQTRPAPQRYAQARYFWTPRGAYELLAVGNADELNPETADTFIRSATVE
jgi:phenylpyruvate tautomerase PptA (4-oxalocrotonate tautomerase family)